MKCLTTLNWICIFAFVPTAIGTHEEWPEMPELYFVANDISRNSASSPAADDSTSADITTATVAATETASNADSVTENSEAITKTGTTAEDTTVSQSPIIEGEVTPSHWEQLARKRFKKDCSIFPKLKNAKRAKNVILLLGDGMGMQTIAAGRFYRAQQEGMNGSIAKHPCEEWPFNTMARTYDLETSTTDSASSATAYLTGTKTRTGMIGLNGNIKFKQCGVWDEKHYTESALVAAHRMGKAVGVMTNTRITHASPSGCYGHVSFRDLENDVAVKDMCPQSYVNMTCQDLACQLLTKHSYIDVIIGGGQKNFYPNNESLPSNQTAKGVRQDGQNLVNIWKENAQSTFNDSGRYCYVSRPSDLKTCDLSKTERILALPYEDHMPYAYEIEGDEPNLLDYVRAALRILERKPNGYFLFIESGRIDHAHHDNEGRRSLSEMKLFDEIMAYVQNTVNLEETLVIVTADHSHAFELVGQPGRFQDILGIDEYYSYNTNDEKPMQGLNYMNGPNGLNGTNRTNPLEEPIYDWTYRQQTLIPLQYATHGGDDVGVYAIGPMAEIFHLTVDNTMIAQAMKFALGAPPYDNTERPCDL